MQRAHAVRSCRNRASEQAGSIVGRIRRGNIPSADGARRDFTEDRRREESAKMPVADVVEHHQDHQARIVSRQKSHERRHQPVLEVAAVGGIHHLRSAGLARDGKSATCAMAGAVGHHDVAQQQVHLMRHIGRDRAAQNLRRMPQNFVAVRIVGRLDHVRTSPGSAISDRSIGGRELDRRDRNALSEAMIGEFDLPPCGRPFNSPPPSPGRSIPVRGRVRTHSSLRKSAPSRASARFSPRRYSTRLR